jgi:hypothetical protein
MVMRETLDPVRWTMHKDGGRMAQCCIVRHPLGFELRVDIDGDTRLTRVYRLEADADIHATALEDQFLEKGWG